MSPIAINTRDKQARVRISFQRLSGCFSWTGGSTSDMPIWTSLDFKLSSFVIVCLSSDIYYSGINRGLNDRIGVRHLAHARHTPGTHANSEWTRARLLRHIWGRLLPRTTHNQFDIAAHLTRWAPPTISIRYLCSFCFVRLSRLLSSCPFCSPLFLGATLSLNPRVRLPQTCFIAVMNACSRM